MISAFENMARQNPLRTFFTDVERADKETAYSYREVRLYAAALAKLLRDKGARQGDCIAVDVRNRAAGVFLLLAAGYGGYTLIAINNRLSESEKMHRLMEVERDPGVHVAFRIDENNIEAIMDRVETFLGGELHRVRSGAAQAAANERVSRTSFVTRTRVETADVRTSKALGRATGGRDSLIRREEMARQEALENAINFADHAKHVFDQSARAVIMFTSGTTGRPKAVALSWANLSQAALAANAVLGRRGEGMWQAVLPLYHIGGLQVVVRSILNGTPFLLYRHFDADKVLADASRRNATHIAVVDKMLQDMCESERSAALKRYTCILLGGGAPNSRTLEVAWGKQARVYVSYGMTETSSHVANALIDMNYKGGLKLLPGYQAHIVGAGSDGFGRLAVKGPGVFSGYLNAHAAWTVDGFFLTGDIGAIHNGLLYVKERVSDMFVSGGENIYPEEVRQKLLGIPGVADAFVFGAPDKTWGRRPIAFVVREPRRVESFPQTPDGTNRSTDHQHALKMANMSNTRFSLAVKEMAAGSMSKLHLPKHVCVIDEMPMLGTGKIDRQALLRRFDERIQVENVVVRRVKLPSSAHGAYPLGEHANARETARETLIVEVIDHQGRSGIGELAVSTGGWNAAGDVAQNEAVLKEVLAPIVLSHVFLHPSEVSDVFALNAQAVQHPRACGAIEPALWDLYGKIVGAPLWKLIGGNSNGRVPVAALVDETDPVAAARVAVAQMRTGSPCVRLKVHPGSASVCAVAVADAIGATKLIIDAGRSFTETDMDELRTIDSLGVAWIEEPLDPRKVPLTVHGDIFDRTARLQRGMRTPLGMSEALAVPKDALRALRNRELKHLSVNIGRMGGVQPALEFVRLCRTHGVTVWVSAGASTDASKRLHATFETLPGVVPAGDLGLVGREATRGVTTPPLSAERGMVTLNRTGFATGLGCVLNPAALEDTAATRNSENNGNNGIVL
ncbi:AMP-binding protein [Adlercreutzia sp. ZJ138]|uniref:AMP-binding protein n=1 Tax=Adlercreutzia sp. ZJ138 TaxID=2709405 RepID=UPI0013EB0F6B|nr:AMP-binding protein [Adlercreutzia sp. ZJ138]